MEVLLFRQDLSVTISITTMRSSKVTITGLPRKRSHLFAELPSLISHLSSPVSRCMPSQTITLVLSVTVTINSKSISIGTITDWVETHLIQNSVSCFIKCWTLLFTYTLNIVLISFCVIPLLHYGFLMSDCVRPRRRRRCCCCCLFLFQPP